MYLLNCTLKSKLKAEWFKVSAVLVLFSVVFVFMIHTTRGNFEMTGTITFIPKGLDQELSNPYMGWAPPADGADYIQPHRLVYTNLNWAEIEPVEGFFDFEKIEAINKFSYWTRLDIKIILRVVLDKPKETSQMDIPEWLFRKIQGDGTWYDNEYGKGFSPNYSNPVLISYHKKLLRKMAEHYDHDNRIAFIELGSLGHWGEWHTKDVRNPFPKAEIADQYVYHYLDNFTNKYLLLRRPMVIAVKNNLGLYNDMFGDRQATIDGFVKWINNGYQFWLTDEMIPGMPEFWKYAPSGGEFAPFSKETFRNSNIGNLIQQAKLSHVSWLGPNCPINKRWPWYIQKNINKLLKVIGYRFVLEKEEHRKIVKPGEKLEVMMNWSNKGIAPFYFDWEMELSLADPKGNIIASSRQLGVVPKLLPGNTKHVQTLTIPSVLAPGNYNLCIAIINPETEKPGIALAIKGRRNDGRYNLGMLKVTHW